VVFGGVLLSVEDIIMETVVELDVWWLPSLIHHSTTFESGTRALYYILCSQLVHAMQTSSYPVSSQ
jgi:hypothetical protein